MVHRAKLNIFKCIIALKSSLKLHYWNISGDFWGIIKVMEGDLSVDLLNHLKQTIDALKDAKM